MSLLRTSAVLGAGVVGLAFVSLAVTREDPDRGPAISGTATPEHGAIIREPDPPPAPGTTAILCNPEEPGERLLVIGRIVDESGNPLAGASVSVYNRDRKVHDHGYYVPPDSPTYQARIRATVTTDEHGQFQVLTVYPRGVVEENDPDHVHVTAYVPRFAFVYSTIWFEGDPLITREVHEKMIEQESRIPNERVRIEKLEKLPGGLKVVRHTIVMPKR